jgi:CarD family transcriptional regulator
MKALPTISKGSYVVYPAHGVGQVLDIQTQEIGGMSLKVVVLEFLHSKSKITVPVSKATQNGLRPVASRKAIKEILQTLRGRHTDTGAKHTWVKRVKVYEAKLNSGSLKEVAELICELYPEAEHDTASYSVRNLYKLAIQRLAQELAIVESIDPDQATRTLEQILKAA